MTIEIVDFPIKNGGSFHSFLLNYQRVNTYSTPKKKSQSSPLHHLKTSACTPRCQDAQQLRFADTAEELCPNFFLGTEKMGIHDRKVG